MNRSLEDLEIDGTVSLRISTELRVSYAGLRYGMTSELTWEAVKFLNFRGEDAPRPPYKLLHFARKFVQM